MWQNQKSNQTSELHTTQIANIKQTNKIKNNSYKLSIHMEQKKTIIGMYLPI